MSDVNNEIEEKDDVEEYTRVATEAAEKSKAAVLDLFEEDDRAAIGGLVITLSDLTADFIYERRLFPNQAAELIEGLIAVYSANAMKQAAAFYKAEFDRQDNLVE